ncbi:hypothetical protein Hanom_Chr10g00888651 [Helianthus anomalus]
MYTGTDDVWYNMVAIQFQFIERKTTKNKKYWYRYKCCSIGFDWAWYDSDRITVIKKYRNVEIK